MANIIISDFLGGYAPDYMGSEFPTYGNRNMASRMRNVFPNSHFLVPGPKPTTLTNGDQVGVVNTLIRSILNRAVANNETYGVGGNKLYKLSSNTVISDANFPHTINHPTATGEVAEDVKFYRGAIYCVYNHSAGGDILKLTLPNTFNSDFLSTIPVGKFTLQAGVPHPMEVGGDDVLYIGNKNFVSSYNGRTNVATEKALDLPPDCVIVDIKYYNQRLYITANEPDLTGDNQIKKSLYIWNLVAKSWDWETPRIGRGGGMFIKSDGVLFIFYQDITSGKSSLGYIDGRQLREVTQFTGSLPQFYQITEYQGFVVWVSDNLLYAWGSGEAQLPARVFQMMKGKHGTVEAISAPFGKMFIASTDGATNFDLSRGLNYETDANWKSMNFDISGAGRTGMVDKILMNFEKLEIGAKLNLTLRDNKNNAFYTTSITGTGKTRFFEKLSKTAENLRIELDYSAGSSTAPVKVKNIFVDTHIIS